MKKITCLFFICFYSLVQAQEPESNSKDIPFAVIEKVPVYPGCNATDSNAELKKCMSNAIIKHVSTNFNLLEISNNLNLPEGTYRIMAAFKINKQGKITAVKARSAFPDLEKEAIRVIQLLPKMDAPGMQKGKPVNVPYSLPIMFKVEDTKKEKKKRRGKK